MRLQFGTLTFDSHLGALSGPAGNIDVGSRALAILELLLARPFELVSKDEILDKVWKGIVVEENALQVQVSALRRVLGAAAITTVHGRGYRYTGPVPQHIEGAVSLAAAEPGRLRVAVDRFSGFGDSIEAAAMLTEDIINALSRYRSLTIVDATLGNTIGGFVLSGSLRRSENRMRIAVRLTESKSGEVMWADHFDRGISGIDLLEEEIAAQIASALVGRLELEIGGRDDGIATNAATAHILKGQWQFRKMTAASFASAANHFRKATELEPGNAEAWRWLAISSNNKWFADFDWNGLIDGQAFANRAIELDPANAGCYSARGFCEMWTGGLAQARLTYDRALALNPDDPHILADTALWHSFAGETDRARGQLDRAMQLHPLPPVWYAEFRAVADFSQRRFAEAFPAFLAIEGGAWDNMYALACCGHLGLNDIVARIASFRDSNGKAPDYRAAAEREPYANPETRNLLLAGLDLALR